MLQGWTRFAQFGDLHDMSEAEWDKVCAVRFLRKLQMFERSVGNLTSILIVLGRQREGTNGLAARGLADI